ncbi:FmdB family zinc ribbon protein [Agromyces bracchium]|uniref:FmdB family transcriptional regulator n=1 Tax=Agromyces bracchium TaxID=88376 RepID=A0A6I3MDK6_9MICO|nr:FmdB family zinc ribbon protein [Agromyces bracchium]MTH70252.1 FmdB family transcriptional regulator [Agromyces bracchium]
MPTYSYRCTECGEAFDIQQAFTDDSLTECPACSGRLRKLYGTVGVTFNGSGFYRTDSRESGSKGAKGGPGSESGTGGSSSSSESASSGSSSSTASSSSTTSSSSTAA